jgi:hypothetical protein
VREPSVDIYLNYADLPESKRWLKEYGARENEAFR